MALIEREPYLAMLQNEMGHIAEGEGHCIFISGEAGIGKTALVKAFCKRQQGRVSVYRGSCDALFTPQPLAPLYDILVQMEVAAEIITGPVDRTVLFSQLFQALRSRTGGSLIVFEDIHWADEATLDFIKFLSRRISQVPCIFILTYRDEEIHSRHPLRNVLGQLTPDTLTRLQLQPLSKAAVLGMAGEKGYDGENVYQISGGNPFYVNEILASYSPGVPDNIKDSILSVLNRQDEKTRYIWEILSVMPTGLEIGLMDKLASAHASSLESSLESGIIQVRAGVLTFKHELYRRTVEYSLSPFLRIALNRQVLQVLIEQREKERSIERIIHHAKHANAYEVVVEYAPQAAVNAAQVGAHVESSRLWLAAIEYYQSDDPDLLVRFYEAYAYECYLTNQVREAIIYMSKALAIWKSKNDIERTGNCLRWLSRLWWYEGNRQKAELFGVQAIGLLEDQPASKAKAMAFSNMSQLKMLSAESEAALYWGERAIALATELNDEEILAHALNNVGGVRMYSRSTMQEGIALLRQSLAIALRHSFDDHAGRAYTNLGYNALVSNNFKLAREVLDEGIHYCEERDLDSQRSYMMMCRSRLFLETGQLKEASSIAGDLLKYEHQPPVVKIGALVVAGVVGIRKGEFDKLALLLEAKKLAFQAFELQRILPVLAALLEYEWLTGDIHITEEELRQTCELARQSTYEYEIHYLQFWLQIVRGIVPDIGIDLVPRSAAQWKELGCPYEYALTLYEGDEDDKRMALTLIQQQGGQTATYEKLRQEMRNSGIKSIPRGARKTTQANPAQLTQRELDVLQCLYEGLQNKEIASKLFISAKTVDHHISSILYKLEVNSRQKAVQEAVRMKILK